MRSYITEYFKVLIHNLFHLLIGSTIEEISTNQGANTIMCFQFVIILTFLNISVEIRG